MNAPYRIASGIAATLLSLSAACGGGGADRASDSAAATDTAAPAASAGATPSADAQDDRVERALDADATLQAFGLDADDEDGRIVLKGVVGTAEQKALAAQIATREAAGVAIDDRIRVDAAAARTGARPTDVDEVEDRVEDALEADSALRELDIDVDEEDGTLVLDGTVRTAAQRASAEEIARRVAGGVTVVNRLRVQ
jgi:osmotically-inducible protein OsmY